MFNQICFAKNIAINNLRHEMFTPLTVQMSITYMQRSMCTHHSFTSFHFYWNQLVVHNCRYSQLNARLLEHAGDYYSFFFVFSFFGDKFLLSFIFLFFLGYSFMYSFSTKRLCNYFVNLQHIEQSRCTR